MTPAKPPPPCEVLVAISFWDGDRELCRKMVDLIVDLEPVHVGRRAGILLVHRQDCKVDNEMVAKLKTRFDVLVHKSDSPNRGWPQGCNGMFSSTILHVRRWKIPCKCIYWMEADCTPMYPGWFDDLAQAWRERKPMTLVKGWTGDCNGDGTGWHITGCALYDPEIAIKMPFITSTAGGAWDYEHRRAIMARGERTTLIENWYRKNKAPDSLMDKKYAVVHGIKDGSLCDMVRKKYLTRKPDSQ
jgi:hypothetical protein